ncbi:hypothetical protein DLH72_02985 [Candidatus Gracilibacteria bacterium]|nr:MAG: hypothetical protein DLH72_02985 [Candidatus Gracilibacteria bacterium]
MKIIFIRHAESIANRAGNQVGYNTNTDKLTEKGEKQAEKLQKIVEKIVRNIRKNCEQIIEIHCSDTNRAKHTRDIAIQNQSFDFIINKSSKKLNEIDIGDIEYENLREKIISIFKGNPDTHFRNGESRKDVYIRAKKYLNKLNTENLHIIFSHGITIKSIIEGELNIWDEEIHIKNTDLVIYDTDNKKFDFKKIFV